MYIGKRIKKLRLSSGIERRDLAKGIISHTHLSNIENGKYNGSPDILIAFANKLKVPKEYLLNYKDIDIILLNNLHSLKAKLDQLEVTEAEDAFREIKKNYPFINSIVLETYFYLLMSHYYITVSQNEDAFTIYENEILPLLDGINIETLFIEAKETYYYINGVFNYYKNNFKLSHHFFSNQIPLIRDESMKARTNLNIGLCLYKINDIYQAINYTKTAQNLYISSRNWSKIAETDNLLGVLYLRLNDYISSVNHLNNALNISERFEFTTLKPLTLHNLGLLEQRKGNLEEALIYLNNSLELKRNTKLNILVSYIALLEILLEKKLIDLVKKNLEDAKKYCNATIDRYHLMVIEARMYQLLEQNELYERNMKEAIDYYFKNKLWKYVMETSKDFAVYYELQKKYKYSTLYYKIYSEAIINFYLL